MTNHDSREPTAGSDSGADQPPGTQAPATPSGPGGAGVGDADPGLAREVGDIEDPDDDGALPGRMGGGLAGG